MGQRKFIQLFDDVRATTGTCDTSMFNSARCRTLGVLITSSLTAKVVCGLSESFSGIFSTITQLFPGLNSSHRTPGISVSSSSMFTAADRGARWTGTFCCNTATSSNFLRVRTISIQRDTNYLRILRFSRHASVTPDCGGR